MSEAMYTYQRTMVMSVVTFSSKYAQILIPQKSRIIPPCRHLREVINFHLKVNDRLRLVVPKAPLQLKRAIV